MLSRELRHQELELALSLDSGRLQQLLHHFEYGDDVAAFFRMFIVWGKELRKEQYYRGQQTFCRVIKNAF